MNAKELAQSAEQGHSHDVVSCRDCTRARQGDRTKAGPTPRRGQVEQHTGRGGVAWVRKTFGRLPARPPVEGAPQVTYLAVVDGDGYVRAAGGALQRTTPRRGKNARQRHGAMVKAPS